MSAAVSQIESALITKSNIYQPPLLAVFFFTNFCILCLTMTPGTGPEGVWTSWRTVSFTAVQSRGKGVQPASGPVPRTLRELDPKGPYRSKCSTMVGGQQVLAYTGVSRDTRGFV